MYHLLINNVKCSFIQRLLIRRQNWSLVSSLLSRGMTSSGFDPERISSLTIEPNSSALLRHLIAVRSPVLQHVTYSTSVEDGDKDKDKDKEKENDKKQPPLPPEISFPITVLFVLTFAWLMGFQRGASNVSEKSEITWSDFFYRVLPSGEIDYIEIGADTVNDDGGSQVNTHLVRVHLHSGAIIKGIPTEYRMLYFKINNIDDFESHLRKTEESLGISPNQGISLVYTRMSPFQIIVPVLIVFTIFGVILRAFMKRGGKASLSISLGDNLRQARYKLVDSFSRQSTPKVYFKDVAGLHEAKIEVQEFVNYLKKPELFTKLGAKLPKGALLLGPPGCGKTLLAKAVATEASVPFLATSGTEFIEMIGGLGASRVRDLFKQAKQKAPCIIYIDEIDALGRSRSQGGMNVSSGEEEQTLNQLLVELDGMDSSSNVVVLASTNREDILDKALMRRGRFDRHVLIDLPTMIERREIFELYLNNIKLGASVLDTAAKFAEMTPGFSGADINNVVNEAAIHAATSGKRQVSGKDMDFAFERVVAGAIKRTSALSPHEKKVVAYHEAGHALAGWLLKHTDALLKVSIVPRTGAALGFAQYNPRDIKLHSKEDLFDRMCMMLGGRVAESLTFGQITTGAEDDLRKVTRTAFDQIKVYGMSERIGPLSFGSSQEQTSGQFYSKPFSKQLSADMDREAQRLIGSTYKFTEDLIKQNIDKLEKIANALLERETVNYEDIKRLIGPPPFGDKNTVQSVDSVLSSSQETPLKNS